MALGVLNIMYIVIVIVAIIVQILLYIKKYKLNAAIFVINILFVFMTSVLAFSSLPSNFALQRVVAIAWAVIAILAALLRLRDEKFDFISKIMISIAMAGSIVQLML